MAQHRLLLAGVAWLAGMATAMAAGDTLKIGVLHATSGPLAVLGDASDKTVKLIREQAGSGKFDVGPGRNVEIRQYDTEGNATKAAQLFRRLIDNDEVDVVIGPNTSGETLPIMLIAEEMKISLVAYGAVEAITKPVRKYVFSMTPVDRVVIQDLLGAMKKRNVKRPALIYSLDGYGQSGAEFMKDLVKNYDMELSSIQTFAPQDTNMQPQLIKMREAKPDAYILWSSANPAPTITLRTAKELGIKETFYVGHGNGSLPFLKQTGAAGEGAVAPAFPILAPEVLPDSDKRKPVVLAFQKDFIARWNEPPDQSAAYALDALLVVQAAAKAVKGPLTRDNLRDAIENLKGMCGSVGCRELSATDHRGLEKDIMVLLQIKNGRWVAFD